MTPPTSPGGSLLADAACCLADAGIDSPLLDAELLLEHVSGIPRLRRRVLDGPPPSHDIVHRFLELVRQRAQRIPLQHLVGFAHFLDLQLRVSPDVLIPRPETEQLVLLAARGIPTDTPLRILDIGTGSGCIAIALARLFRRARITAVDISPAALSIARENARSTGVEPSIHFLQLDAFAPNASLAGRGPFDLVVTNPPYIPAADLAHLQPEVRDHDPVLALDGGPDGLAPYRHLAAQGARLFESTPHPPDRPRPRLLAEFGDGQAPALVDLFRQNGWNDICVEKDLSGSERVLIVRPPLDPSH